MFLLIILLVNLFLEEGAVKAATLLEDAYPRTAYNAATLYLAMVPDKLYYTTAFIYRAYFAFIVTLSSVSGQGEHRADQ